MAIGGHDIISMNRTSHCTNGEVHIVPTVKFIFYFEYHNCSSPVVLNVYTAHCPLSSNKNRQASSCSLRCWTPGASQQEMWDAPSSGCHRGGGKCVGETGIKPEEFVIILIIVMTLLVMSFAIWKVSFSVKVPRLWPPTCSVAVRTFPPFPSGRPNITRFEYEEPLRVSGFRYGFQE